MKKFAALVLIATAATASAEVLSFNLGTAFDKDLVFEQGAGASAEKFGENPDGTQAFVENGVLGADGLPSNRTVPSPTGFGSYELADYAAANAIELASHAEAAAESHAIDVPDRSYRRLGLLVASVDGDTSFTIKLVYADGTESLDWWEADDWYQPQLSRGNCMPAAANMDQYNTATGMVDDHNHFQLYEFVFQNIDTTKVLKSIEIGNDPHRFDAMKKSWGALFAIIAETASDR